MNIWEARLELWSAPGHVFWRAVCFWPSRVSFSPGRRSPTIEQTWRRHDLGHATRFTHHIALGTRPRARIARTRPRARAAHGFPKEKRVP